MSSRSEADVEARRPVAHLRLGLEIRGREVVLREGVHRCGPGGERLRAGQLRVLGFRVPGAGALLDGAPQRRLLNGMTSLMKILTWSRARLAAALIAGMTLTAGCGLLDTTQPGIIEPGSLDTPEGAASLRLG